jgi:hypothetical protein
VGTHAACLTCASSWHARLLAWVQVLLAQGLSSSGISRLTPLLDRWHQFHLALGPVVLPGCKRLFATMISARSPSHRRQSIESTLSGADDSTSHSRMPSVAAPAPVDKSRLSMMTLPLPPRAPSPPNGMPPSQPIPERRIPTSPSLHDVALGRPASSPPAEL